MEKIISEIEKALEYGLYFIALQSALTLPDICGALMSGENTKVRERYVLWYNEYFQKRYNLMLSAEDCYFFRCANIHQGRFQHVNSSYDRVAFITGPNIIDDNFISAKNPNTGRIETMYTIDIRLFCVRMIECVRIWLETVKDDETFKSNYAKMAKVHEEGLPQLFTGSPAIY